MKAWGLLPFRGHSDLTVGPFLPMNSFLCLPLSTLTSAAKGTSQPAPCPAGEVPWMSGLHATVWPGWAPLAGS